jgi:hypothetical protein
MSGACVILGEHPAAMIVGAAWVVMPDAVPKPSAATCVNCARVLWPKPGRISSAVLAER